MIRGFSRWTLTTLALTLPVTATAEPFKLPVDPDPKGDSAFEAALHLTTIEYEFDGETQDYDKQALSFAYGAAVSKTISVVGSFLYVLSTEPEDSDLELSGFGFGGAARANVYASGADAVYVTAGLTYQKETGSEGNFDVEMTLMEVPLGVAYHHALSSSVAAYGGAEITLVSDGESEFSGGGFSADADYERSDKFALQAGGLYSTGKVFGSLGVALLGEQTISIGGGVKL